MDKNKRHGRSNKKSDKPKAKSNQNFIREARARAEERFSRIEKPMGFPDEEWEPNTIEMEWK